MTSSAFALILLSAIMHAAWNFFTKTTTAHRISMLWMGWLIAGCITLPFAIYFTDFSTFSLAWFPYIILTTIVHALYIYLLGWSYSIGEMSLIYPMARGFAILVTLTIVTLLGLDSISTKGFLGICMLASGILLVCIKRIRDLEKQAAMKAAIMVGCCVSCYSIIDKMSLSHIPPLFYMSIMFITSPLLLTPIMLKQFRNQTILVYKKYKIFSGMVGVVSLLTYYLILLALLVSPTSYVVALREISIVFGSILGIWLLKEERNKRKLLGIVVILLGAVIIKTS